MHPRCIHIRIWKVVLAQGSRVEIGTAIETVAGIFIAQQRFREGNSQTRKVWDGVAGDARNFIFVEIEITYIHVFGQNVYATRIKAARSEIVKPGFGKIFADTRQ